MNKTDLDFRGFRLDESEKIKSRSFLENYYKYFLQFVVILQYEGFFRLLVIHKNMLLVDRYYRTFKGAKIAFLKFFGHKAWKKGEEPVWSEFEEFDEKKNMKYYYNRMAKQ